MLYFIIPLRSARSTHNWTLTRRLLARTLRNLSAQRSSNWRILVVASEDPGIAELNSPRTSLQLVDLPVPSSNEERRRDKSAKIIAGVDAAFQSATADPDLSIMIVDADDLVSIRLSSFIESAGPAFGYCLNRGYLHAPGARFAWTHNRFNRVCGTSCIINARQFGNSYFTEASEVTALLGGLHAEWCDSMAARGTPLTNLPFRGAIYSVSTGDNYTGFTLGRRWKPWRAAWVSKHMIAEFPGIETPP